MLKAFFYKYAATSAISIAISIRLSWMRLIYSSALPKFNHKVVHIK